ncbi:hypothetical protein V6V47_22090 [Micromonospora sp. CPCC 205539]|uniref:hypothetical protein n=1 Tax=Micromonospora sp. CPCC 205539 TaxID=3122408 RepID=UPI002FF16840
MQATQIHEVCVLVVLIKIRLGFEDVPDVRQVGGGRVKAEAVKAFVNVHDAIMPSARWDATAELPPGRTLSASQREGGGGCPSIFRAAHLVDATRAYLQTDDLTSAAREVVARVARDPDAPGTITELAFNLGVV